MYAFLNRVCKCEKGKVGGELFKPRLISEQSDHGLLALTPLKVLCAGFSDWHVGAISFLVARGKEVNSGSKTSYK